MHRICAALHNHGYEITLVGFVKKNSVALSDKPYNQKRIKVTFKKGKLFYAEYNYKLLQLLNKNNFDIFCAIDLDTILPVSKAAEKANKPLVLDAHEMYLGLPEIMNRKFVKAIWTRLERKIYPRLKYAYTVNESIAQHYKTEYGVPFKVIMNVPEVSAMNNYKSEEQTILYQGALNVGRGLEELIKAMQFVEGKLSIAGTGEIDNDLKSLVKKLNLQNKVNFLGYLLPEKLKTVSDQSYIGVNLLNGDSLNYYYSLANKFFDYIHAGIPQLSMNFPEYRKINFKYDVAELLDDLDPKNIAAKLNKLLQDKSYYNKKVAECIKAKNEYNWEKESNKLIEFYKKIV